MRPTMSALASMGVVLLLVVTGGAAFGAKGGNGGGGGGNGGGGGGQGSLTTTISLVETARTATSAGSVTFNVTRSYAYDKDVIYVTNQCWDADGALVIDDDTAVSWGTWDSLEGSAGPSPTGGTHCTAYVTLKPWADVVYDGTTIDFSVA